MLVLCAAPALAQFSPPAQITVVTDDNYPPYLFRDAEGRLQGIVKDKWELWSAKTGVAVKLDGMEWSRAQQSVGASGKADVIDVFSPNPARDKLYEYSPAWGKFESRVFFHRSISGINDARSMRGFTVGTKEASSCTNWLRQNGIESVRSYPDSEALVRAAGAGEVRLFCMDVPAAQYYLFKHRIADDFRQTASVNSADLVWAVAKGRTALRDFVQGGFDRIGAAELQEIDARWMGNPVRLPIQPRYFLYVAGVAATLLAFALLMLLWNRSLSRRVAASTEEVSGQNHVLELIAAGAPLQNSMEALLRLLERGSVDMASALTLLDDDGAFVRFCAAPSLPDSFVREMDPQPVGESAGCCGTAAYRREPVIVEDIATSPLWERRRHVALAHGLRACWSTPIFDAQKRVLGTFALFYRAARRPDRSDLRLIEIATHVAAIAIAKAKGERERERLVHDLGERVKELAVLHAVARLFQEERAIDGGLIRELVLLLPSGWQFPEICVARIVYGDIEERTPGWRETQWRQAARFDAVDGPSGLVEVAYLEERPFLAEERTLIDSLAELLGANFGRIRIQDALRESEAQLTLSVRASSVGLWDWNLADNQVYFSPEWKKMLGYGEDEIPVRLGEWNKRLHPEDRAGVRAKLQAFLRSSRTDYQNEFRMQHKDGSYRWIYARGELERDAGGKPLRMRGGHVDITDRKRAEDEVRLHAERLRALSQRLMDVEEIERRNINRELHDSIAQNLSALQVNLVTLRMELAASASQATRARIDDAHALLENTSTRVRDVMAVLRPAALDDFGLLAALRDHGATFSARYGIAVAVLGRDPAPRLPLATETALFRIAQEALNNVAKHARARKAQVKVDADPKIVRVTISDDGAGFDAARPPQRAAHYGIATMRERAEAVGASLRIESAPGKGTRVEIELILPAAEAAA